MVQAYIDDSISADGVVYVLAGYLAPAQNWAAFSDEWQQFRDMKPAISYFKMNDAMGLDGEFKFWSKQARDEKLSLLFGVIGDHATASVSCTLRTTDFKAVFGKDKSVPRQLRSPYYFLLYGMMQALAEHRDRLKITEPIDFIFDEQVIEKDRIMKDWELFKQASPVPLKLIGDPPIFRDDKRVLPLQAADMYAWRMRKSLETKFGAVKPFPIPRIKRQKIIPGLSFIWTEESLSKLKTQITNFRLPISLTYGGHHYAGVPKKS